MSILTGIQCESLNKNRFQRLQFFKKNVALDIGPSRVRALPCSTANVVAAINGVIFSFSLSSSSGLFTFLPEVGYIGF